MARVEHAAIAIILLVAFVADLRFLVPVLAVLLAARAVLRVSDRFESTAAAALLGAASVAFVVGNELAAWVLVITVAVLSGVVAGRPRAVAHAANR